MISFKKSFDFVAVGDNTTDAFITLKDATVECDVDKHNCKLCVDFGAKIPYESVEVISGVGNSANAAVSAARLGLRSAFVSDIGNDENGRNSLKAWEKDGVSTKLVTTHRGQQSNYHYVLCYEAERTILVKHQEYPYRFPTNFTAKWLYVSSLGENSEPYHQEIAAYMKKNPGTKLALQPGTFQIRLGTEKLRELYQLTTVFICNVEEAQTILKNDSSDVKALLSGLAALGPKIVVITDGQKGLYSFDGAEMLSMRIYPDPKPPVQRTGAGDAFASTFVSALALGKPVSEALRWGPINSMSVVQHVGAQKGLLPRAQLEKLLASAPADYAPKKI